MSRSIYCQNLYVKMFILWSSLVLNPFLNNFKRWLQRWQFFTWPRSFCCFCPCKRREWERDDVALCVWCWLGDRGEYCTCPPAAPAPPCAAPSAFWEPPPSWCTPPPSPSAGQSSSAWTRLKAQTTTALDCTFTLTTLQNQSETDRSGSIILPREENCGARSTKLTHCRTSSSLMQVLLPTCSHLAHLLLISEPTLTVTDHWWLLKLSVTETHTHLE